VKRALATALVAVIALVCYACGGGGCNNDCPPDVPTPAVDCKAKPEQCK
jgi:hypothetical protein